MRGEAPRVGYVLKRYPRYSETFIVNEILAHEEAGLDIEIFALRRPTDPPSAASRVRAPVNYLRHESDPAVPHGEEGEKEERRWILTAHHFWLALRQATELVPDVWRLLPNARPQRARHVYQALLLAAHVRTKGISHLHAHFATSATTVARLAAHFAGVPYTFTCHAKDIFHESVRREDLQAKLIAAAATVTVSDFNVEYLRRHYGPAADAVQRIYNGLDLALFSYRPAVDPAPRIVAVGRLVEKKGFADLIEACAVLSRRGRSFDCRIVGAGELERDLRERIERLQLGDRVSLLGVRSTSEVVALIQEAAVVAVPSVVGSDGNREGLPTVLLEAMALGTPCVATDVTGIPEVLRDGETGLMVHEREPEALATAIERLLNDFALRRELASRARRAVEKDFDIHRNTVALRQVFREAIEKHESPLEETA